MKNDDLASTTPVSLHAILDGRRGGKPVLLLTGLGQQAIDWPDSLIAWLLAQGYWVIRPDNRDAGLSPLCGAAELSELSMADFPSDTSVTASPTYRLEDMASDVLALMDRLDIAAAHVIGFSMGGMIAQILAATAPQRVLSLTSLMSSGGQAWIDCRPEAWMAMARSICTVAGMEGRVRRYIEDALIYVGSAYPHDPVALRQHAIAALSRSYRPAGIWRQALAVRAAGDRRGLLRQIPVPTLIIHGTEDNCIAPHQAQEGHGLIADSRFLLLKGVGHDLHPSLIPRLLPILSETLGVVSPTPRVPV